MPIKFQAIATDWENGRIEMHKALGAKPVERKDEWRKILFLVYHSLQDDSEDTRHTKAQVKGLRLNGHEVHLCHFNLDERGKICLYVDDKKMRGGDTSLAAVVTFSDEEQLFDQRTILINCPDNTGSSADGTTWRQEMQRVVDALME